MLKFWKKKPPDADKAAAPMRTDDTVPALAEAPAAAAIDAEAPLAAEPADDAPEAIPARRSWRERLSGSGFARGLASIFKRNPVLDDAFLDELETCLITADVGIGLSLSMTLGFLALCLTTVWWIFRTGWRLKT